MTNGEWWMSVDAEYIDQWNTVYRIKRTRGGGVQWWSGYRGEWVIERKYATTYCGDHLAEAALSKIVRKTEYERLPVFGQHIIGWGIEGERTLFGDTTHD